MRLWLFFAFPLLLASCASSRVAKKLNFVSFEDYSLQSAKEVGGIEGKDCRWSLLGYPLGDDPSVRLAIESARYRTKGNLMPGMKDEAKGQRLKALKNVNVDDAGFNAWIIARNCIVVSALGVE